MKKIKDAKTNDEQKDFADNNKPIINQISELQKEYEFDYINIFFSKINCTETIKKLSNFLNKDKVNIGLTIH